MVDKCRVLFYWIWMKFNGGMSGGQMKVCDVFVYFQVLEWFEFKVYFLFLMFWVDYFGNVWCFFC